MVPNPEANSRLRAVIQNSKAANMPKEKCRTRYQKSETDKDTANYKEVLFEGYAPHGVAILVETQQTDDNRTVANIRSYFNKCNGTFGTQGFSEIMFNNSVISEFLQKDEIKNKLELIDFGVKKFC